MPETRTIAIKIDHLKCKGCATTITKALSQIKGVLSVTVDMEKQEVIVTIAEVADLKGIKRKLKNLGYPESGTTHGLEKLTSNVISYASCAIGRIEKSNSGTAK